jgi:hypothetical protein
MSLPLGASAHPWDGFGYASGSDTEGRIVLREYERHICQLRASRQWLLGAAESVKARPTTSAAEAGSLASLIFMHPAYLRSANVQRETTQPPKENMKGILITLLSTALASAALAQQATDNTTTGPTKKVRNQMTGQHHGIGTVDAFRPGESITVMTTLENHPVKYVLGKNVQYQTQNGGSSNPRDIRAGTKVSLEFGENNQVSRVIVLDQTGAR